MLGLKKLSRDLWRSRSRTLATLAAIALALVAFDSVLGAFGILAREIRRNYVDSVPASATLDLDDVPASLLGEVERRPGIAAATRRKTVHGRFRLEPDAPWRRALVFVVDDFEGMRVAKLFHERGASAPPLGSVLIERSALGELGGGVGTELSLKLPSANAGRVRVAGVVHEPALAPANTEQAVYLYMSAETAMTLGDSGRFDELRVLVDGPNERARIESAALALARFISEKQLGSVHGIRVPPPLQHPHQTQMTTVLVLFVVFGVFLLIMSSFLASALMATLLARQRREIGVMKAVGAKTSQLALLYAFALLGLSALALAMAWIPGKLGASLFAGAVARLLNFDIASHAQPGWIAALQASVGLLLPTIVAMPTIWSGSRVTIREALNDRGVSGGRFAAGRFERWASRLGGPRPALAYAARSLVRSRGRLLAPFGLLVTAGGAFVAALSVAGAWDALVRRLYESRHYDVEVILDASTGAHAVAHRLTETAGVHAVEVWRSAPVAPAGARQVPIQHTYPDDAHGAFRLVAPPDGARMLEVTLTEGRWLRPTDTAAVVVNQMVPGFDRLALGDELVLAIEGESRSLRIVGKTEQVGVGATAYVSARTFDEVVAAGAQSSMLWVDIAPNGPDAVESSTIVDLARQLDESGADVQSVLPLSVFRNAMAAHFELLVKALLALAALTGLVGALGLSSAMSVSVLSRAREFGVLRALGATGPQIKRAVLLEGLLTGLCSLAFAFALGVILSSILGGVVGRLSFRFPLPWTLSGPALVAWTLAALSLSTLGTWFPAARAARATVREALNAL